MSSCSRSSLAGRFGFDLAAVLLILGMLTPHAVAAQGLTGILIGTVRDPQGGVLPTASVTITSSALIDGTRTLEGAGVAVVSRNYEGSTHEFFGMGAAVSDAQAAMTFAAGELKKAFAVVR